MGFFETLWQTLFPSNPVKGSGTPADQVAHDARGDETVDSKTGIAEVDGQILDTTEIDPEIQDKAEDKFKLLPGDK